MAMIGRMEPGVVPTEQLDMLVRVGVMAADMVMMRPRPQHETPADRTKAAVRAALGVLLAERYIVAASAEDLKERFGIQGCGTVFREAPGAPS